MSDFTWPWQYEFPPFFTLQPNLTTRAKQIESWASLVLEYCQHKKIFELDIVEAQQTPLFQNVNLKRKLSVEGINAVLEYLEKTNHVDWLDKQKRRCRITWRTPEEWGKIIYDWVVASGMINTVCTLYELVHGDDTESESFHKLDSTVLKQALQRLQSEGKAELMNIGGNEGVKFF